MSDLCEKCSKFDLWDLFGDEIKYEKTDTPKSEKDDIPNHEKWSWTFTPDAATKTFVAAENISSLLRSAQEGCSNCAFLWQSLSRQHTEDYRSFEQNLPIKISLSTDREPALYKASGNLDLDPSYQYQWVGPYIHLEMGHNLLFLDVVLAGLDARKLPKADCMDETLFTQANTWISKCLRNHKECHKLVERSLPARLIYVGQKPDFNHTRLMTHHEYSQDKVQTQYLALSYVWGDRRDHVTTIGNLDSRLVQFNLETMPKTIRDSVIITRMLGFNYLWIDSICIVQDLDADRDANIAMMDAIYAGAICVLAASRGRDADAGMLLDRDWAKFNVPKIRLPPLTHNFRKNHIDDMVKKWPQLKDSVEKMVWDTKVEYQHRPLFSLASTVSQSPLETRGWVFQERLLAARRLCFTELGLLWECNEHVTTETGDFSRFKWVHDPNTTQDLLSIDLGLRLRPARCFNSWSRLCEYYSQRRFSRPTDVLPALAGVAREWQRLNNPDDQYLAGLWRSTVTWDLCWDMGRPSRPDQELTCPYLPEQPSWSWAAQQQQDIRYPIILPESVRPLSVCIDASIEPQSTALYSSVVSGSLILEGRLARIDEASLPRSAVVPILTSQHTPPVDHLSPCLPGFVRPDWMNEPLVWQDWTSKTIHRDSHNCYAFFLIKQHATWRQEGHWDFYALVLKRNDPDSFRRVGLCSMEGREENAFSDLDWTEIRLI